MKKDRSKLTRHQRAEVEALTKKKESSDVDRDFQLFRPNRGWFIAAAGAVGSYILSHIDAPLWLSLSTLVVLLAAAISWQWIERSRRRLLYFSCGLVAYALFVGVSVFFARADTTARSHVHVTDMELMTAEVGKAIECRVHFENDGEQKIRYLRNTVLMSVLPRFDDVEKQIKIENAVFDATVEATKSSELVANEVPVHSKANSYQFGTTPISEDLYRKLQNGEYAVYLTGRIKYKGEHDAETRQTDYCYLAMAHRKGLQLCHVHNDEP